MAPEGKYTKVHTVNIEGGPGALNGGTATLSSIGVLSCGPFAPNDLPEVGHHYKITGVSSVDEKTYTFENYKCIASARTSDFKDSSQNSKGTQHN